MKPLPRHAPDTPPYRYLRVQELGHLRRFLFAPRRLIKGGYAGRHASRQRGHCAEFNDYREYTPGDEVADIDWKVFGRSDRLFIKRFEHQTDMTVHLLIDASASMGYAGIDPAPDGPGQKKDARDNAWLKWVGLARGGRAAASEPSSARLSKYDQACLIAAAASFHVINQQDRVAIAFAQRGLHLHLPDGAGHAHLDEMLRSMENMKPSSDARLAQAIHALTRCTPRGGLLVLLSDLMESRPAITDALCAFTARGGEAIVLHVLHEDELNLPDLDEAVFIDSETGDRLRVNVPDIRSRYEQRVRQETDAWRNALTTHGIDYNPVSTATAYHRVLEDYLYTRATV
jgi:uncharacterized protein (DUF58 family)